jgi:hypothetical protein
MAMITPLHLSSFSETRRSPFSTSTAVRRLLTNQAPPTRQLPVAAAFQGMRSAVPLTAKSRNAVCECGEKRREIYDPNGRQVCFTRSALVKATDSSQLRQSTTDIPADRTIERVERVFRAICDLTSLGAV